MEYKNIKYFIEKWKINERRIRVLCAENRIDGAIKVGKTWLIPIDAARPKYGFYSESVSNSK